MKPALTKKELALLMEIINPLKIRKNNFYERLIKKGMGTSAQIDKVADKAYDKLRIEFLKRRKKKKKLNRRNFKSDIPAFPYKLEVHSTVF